MSHAARSLLLALAVALLAAPVAAPAADGWQAPVTLSSAGAGANDARAALGPQGEAAVTWRASAPGTDPAAGSIAAAVRPKGAAQFGAAQSLSDTGVTGTATVAFSPLGEAVAAWSRTAGHGYPYTAESAVLPSGGATFGTGPTLEAAGPPSLAFDGVGNGVLAWAAQSGGKGVVRAAARGPNTWSFDSPGQVSSGTVSASAPVVVFDGAGNATIAWLVASPAPGVQVATRAAGGTFGAPQTISAAGEGPIATLVAAGGGSGAVVAWVRGDGVVRAAARSGTGAFGAPQTLATGAGSDLDAARGSDGTAAVAWATAADPPTASLAVLAPGAGAFAPALTLGAGNRSRVAVAADGAVLAVWAGDRTTPRAAWTAPGGAPGDPVDLGAAEAQGAAIGDVAIGPDGSALAAWSAGIPPSAVVRAATRPGTTPLPPDTEQPTDTGNGQDGGGPQPDAPPSLSRFGLSQGAFYAARGGATIATGTGTTIKWTLDRAAPAFFLVEQASGGRRVGGRCVPDTGRHPNRPHCVIVRRIGRPFSKAGREGFNTARFSGRVGGRALRPGLYRLGAYAKDAGGRSPTSRAQFQIVRR